MRDISLFNSIHKYTMFCYLLFFSLTSLTSSQFLGSSLFSALSGGYGMEDMCRYISCPFGQYCWNGNCISSTSTLGSGLGYGGLGGGLGALTNAAALYTGNTGMYGSGMGMGGYGGMNSIGGGEISGVQGCSLSQQCLNGQICVNGYCSKSNVVLAGSQIIQQQSTCLTGAVCPVGQYCIGGQCMQNALASTFACYNGISCPMGMMCQLGRCIASGLPYMMG